MSTRTSRLRDPRLIAVVLILLCAVVAANLLTFGPRLRRGQEHLLPAAGSMYLPPDLSIVARQARQNGSELIVEKPRQSRVVEADHAAWLDSLAVAGQTAFPWRDPFQRLERNGADPEADPEAGAD